MSPTGWMYVDTPGTFNSPIILGFVGSLKSIVHNGSMFLNVTMYALSSINLADQILSSGAISPTFPITSYSVLSAFNPKTNT